MQQGSVIREHRKLGPDVWCYRWWESPNRLGLCLFGPFLCLRWDRRFSVSARMMAGTTRLELATSAVTASVSFEEPDVTSASSVILRCAMLRLPVVVCPPVTRSPIVPTFRSGMRCSLFRLPFWRQLNAERISNCAVRTGLCDSLTQPWHLMHFVLRYFSLSLVAACTLRLRTSPCGSFRRSTKRISLLSPGTCTLWLARSSTRGPSPTRNH